MTIDEYARRIAERIRLAYNSKDRTAVLDAIHEAEDELNSSNISQAGRAAFWEQAWQIFRSGRLLMEKQEGSALHQLMREIERELAQRQAQGKAEK